jgi:hypothetical protein
VTAEPTSTTTAGADLRSQFPADVQPLLADVPDNLVELLWRVRQDGPGTLVWADAGGEYHEAVRTSWIQEWEQITGWTVQSAPQSGTPGNPPDFEVKVQAGNPEWDIVQSS